VKQEPGRAVTGGGSTAAVVSVSSTAVTLASTAVAPAAANSSPLTTAKAGTTSSVQPEPKVQQCSVYAVISLSC